MNSVDYLEIGGVAYSLDFDSFESLLSLDITKENEEPVEIETTTEFDGTGNPVGSSIMTRQIRRGKEIDMSKYEVIKHMLEIVLGYNEELDDSLGIQRAFDKLPISFKIAFNTLVKYGVLNEIK
jgi:hypothetical protein